MKLKNYNSYSSVFYEISRLEDLFRKQFKRAPKCQLIYSQEGDPKKPVHSLGLWDGDKYTDELEFFTQNIK